MQIIHDDPPMPQEIEAGFYPAFEKRWRVAEIVGRVAMVAFIAANVLGLFGRGLFSERSRANDDGTIAIRYEPVVRFGASTDVVLDTRVPSGGDKVAVTMAKELTDLMGLEKITPTPSVWQVGDGGTRLEFPVLKGAGRVEIRFSGAPTFRGTVHLWARLDKGETVAWSQYSVP